MNSTKRKSQPSEEPTPGSKSSESTAVLEAGRDYYVESGRWVFTADFLRRRGYCCGSGCRHCPYGAFGENPCE